jgi:hypothetical protein
MPNIAKQARKNSESGQIIIFGLVFSMVILMIIGALIEFAAIQARSHKSAVAREKAINIAEAGIERAIWRMNNQFGYSGESNTSYGGGAYNITIQNVSGNVRLIRAEAFVPNQFSPIARRTVQVTAMVGTTNLGFMYGIQVGQGGLEMYNSSSVVGNVYSNSNITGANSARINGTAIAAGPTGTISGMTIDENSYSYSISDSVVGGRADHFVLERTRVGRDASVYSMAGASNNCVISGDAAFDTNNGCRIDGVQISPNTSVPPVPEPIPLPISDEQIAQWELEAERGGVIGSQSFYDGTRTLGPVKINGDLFMTNTAQLVVTGTIWVTGSIILRQSSIIRLHPFFENMSGVVMAGEHGDPNKGFIEINNSTNLFGSGHADSYLMMLSQRTNDNDVAISVSNSGALGIIYAGSGVIEVSNYAALKEITAHKLRLRNNVSITYESGLANALFSSGPGGGWEVMKRTWQLLR